ncbi:hypothetical protein GJ688_13330 [Heliobacillus mobilis]|uniref:GH18 domain-containing protein n=1 Tax=Heliobacterium mobile TaxID=28064 RepID=A0A6I3SMG0_HELMO|nr:glycosyl hydrolase family 18 protein [Heliobacterium mobile]MTV49956.1 hypothetical protein [Heliobacterium mobile]
MPITRAQYAVILENAKKLAETSTSLRSVYPAAPPKETLNPVRMAFFQRGQGQDASEINGRVIEALKNQHTYVQYLNMMSYGMKSDGDVFNGDKTFGDSFFDDVEKLAHEKGLKTLVVLNNYDIWRNCFDAQYAHSVLTSSEKQEKVIQWLVEEIEQNGDSGVNIDFEDLYPADRDLLTQFVAKVNGEMKKHGWTTVVSVMCKTNDTYDYRYYDYENLAKNADYIFVMSYDIYNPRGTPQLPGPNYSIPFVEKTLKFAVMSVPPQKLLLGVGSHSWIWNDSERTQMPAWKADQMVATQQATGYKDPAYNASYATYKSASGGTAKVYYQDQQTYQTEFELVKKYGLGGYGLFPLGWETGSLWTALRNVYPGQ